jgi:hypothetical protein
MRLDNKRTLTSRHLSEANQESYVSGANQESYVSGANQESYVSGANQESYVSKANQESYSKINWHQPDTVTEENYISFQ